MGPLTCGELKSHQVPLLNMTNVRKHRCKKSQERIWIFTPSKSWDLQIAAFCVALKVTEMLAEIEDDANNTTYDYRRTSRLMGHTIFQSNTRQNTRMSRSLTDGLVVVVCTAITSLDFHV